MLNRNCNNEVIVKIVGKITGILNLDLTKQLEIRKAIDEVLYTYEVTTQETGLVASDLEGKVNYFLATKKLEGLSPLTLKNYGYNLAKLLVYFNKPISAITTADIKMFMYAHSEGKQQNSLNSFMIPIRLFFAWCQNEEFIVRNPCANIKPIKEPKRMRTPMTIEQTEILRDSLTKVREKAIFEFAISTGCRVSEICNVKISEIDFINKSLLVIGKGDKQRRVYFTERCKIALKNYIKSRTDNQPWLFVSERKPHKQLGTRALQAIVKKMKIKSGLDIKLHPHIFRHTFATAALNSGMKMEIVQAILGHEDMATTGIYAKLQDDNIQHAYRQLVS
ncbi:MAG: tyrosine-type recombinase/integrase [Clostridium sp.]